MPNQASNAGHVPERKCVICRKKSEKSVLLRMVRVNNDFIIDAKQRLNARGYYICDDNMCLGLMDKWIKKVVKKRNV